MAPWDLLEHLDHPDPLLGCESSVGEALFELGSDLAESPLATERFARGLRARTRELRVLLECREPTIRLVTTLL